MDLNQIMKRLPLTNFTSNTKSDKGTVEPLVFHIKAERSSLNLTKEVNAGLQVRDVTNGDLRLLYFKEATIWS